MENFEREILRHEGIIEELKKQIHEEQIEIDRLKVLHSEEFNAKQMKLEM